VVFAIDNSIPRAEYLSIVLDDMIASLNGSYEVSEINDSELNISNKTIEKLKLATVINGKNIFNDPYARVYLNRYNNFSGIDFKKLGERKKSVLLKAGNVETNVEGFVLNSKRYAIHLVSCNREEGTCNFRINGAIARSLSPNGIDTFNLNENHSIKINSIKIDYCDGRRVCDYYYQAYDLVEMEVVER